MHLRFSCQKVKHFVTVVGGAGQKRDPCSSSCIWRKTSSTWRRKRVHFKVHNWKRKPLQRNSTSRNYDGYSENVPRRFAINLYLHKLNSKKVSLHSMYSKRNVAWKANKIVAQKFKAIPLQLVVKFRITVVRLSWLTAGSWSREFHFVFTTVRLGHGKELIFHSARQVNLERTLWSIPALNSFIVLHGCVLASLRTVPRIPRA